MNLAIQEVAAQKTHKNKFAFKMEDYETAESRVNGLKKILARYDMNPELFDQAQVHDETSLFNCFMSNTENPFLDIKKNSHIRGTLVKQKYIDGKLAIK